MIVPSGSPPWVRTTAMQDYGGHVDKIDYGRIGAVNARTDVTAAQICRLAADAASLQYVSPLFVLELLTVAGSPGTFMVENCRTQWGGVNDTPYPGGITAPAGSVYVENVSGLPGYPTGAGGYVAYISVESFALDAFGVAGNIVVRNAVSSAATLYARSGTNILIFTLPGGAGTRATIVGY